MLITKYQNSTLKRVFQVCQQRICRFFIILTILSPFQILGFSYQDNLVFAHHGKTLGRVQNSHHIGILTIQNTLIKAFFGIGKYILFDVITNLIYIIGFLTVKKVNRFKFPAFKIINKFLDIHFAGANYKILQPPKV